MTKRPFLSRLLLKRICKSTHPELWKDIEEIYSEKVEEEGEKVARYWYRRQLLHAIPDWFNFSCEGGLSMVKNYFIITLRNLKKYWGYSFISLAGLMVGLAVFFLIYTWVCHERSFDGYHENTEYIYRVCERKHFKDQTTESFRTPGLLAHSLLEDFSEIKHAVRVAWTGDRVISDDTNRFYEREIICADKDFFNMFSFDFIRGNPKTVLSNPDSLVISESMARKYFGDENPIGKRLMMDNRYTFVITGLIRDVPKNSHFLFDMAVPFDMVKKLGWMMDTWDFSLAVTYLQLLPGADAKALEKKITSQVESHYGEIRTELTLQPLKDIYLYSNFGSTTGTGRIQYVIIFFVVGCLILLMACINYMNMATARSELRAKEIGIRKVMGASKGILVQQFLWEAILLSLIGYGCMIPLIYLILPEFNSLTGKTFVFLKVMNPGMIAFMFGVSVITGIVAGSYPAMALSSLKPTTIFNYATAGKWRGVKLRTILVTIQIIGFLFLFSATNIINRQLDYLKSLDLGIDKDHVMVIPLGISNRDNARIYESLKNKFRQYQPIQQISGTFTHPFSFGSPARSVTYNGQPLSKEVDIKATSVTFGYIETMKMKLVSGRSFNEKYGKETRHVIVNETFARLLGVDDVLNQKIKLNDFTFTIIGVVKDFHTGLVIRSTIEPLFFFLHPTGINYIIIRISPVKTSDTIEYITRAWEKIIPNIPFQYQFLDDNFLEQFQGLENLGKTIKYFSFIGMFIACLGLLGLSAFAAQERTKEIGIRKVLGSTSTGMVWLFCKNYVKLICVATLIAWPTGWLIMEKWLENFPNRISLGHAPFLISGMISMVITLAVVGYHTVKAANSNPLDTLRKE